MSSIERAIAAVVTALIAGQGLVVPLLAQRGFGRLSATWFLLGEVLVHLAAATLVLVAHWCSSHRMRNSLVAILLASIAGSIVAGCLSSAAASAAV